MQVISGRPGQVEEGAFLEISMLEQVVRTRRFLAIPGGGSEFHMNPAPAIYLDLSETYRISLQRVGTGR